MVETVYGIEAWGQGLLEVLPNGDIGLLDPLTPERPAVPLPMIVRDLRERGIRTPIQLRVQSCAAPRAEAVPSAARSSSQPKPCRSASNPGVGATGAQIPPAISTRTPARRACPAKSAWAAAPCPR